MLPEVNPLFGEGRKCFNMSNLPTFAESVEFFFLRKKKKKHVLFWILLRAIKCPLPEGPLQLFPLTHDTTIRPHDTNKQVQFGVVTFHINTVPAPRLRLVTTKARLSPELRALGVLRTQKLGFPLLTT